MRYIVDDYIFESTIWEYNDKRFLVLLYKTNQYDHQPIKIHLKEIQKLNDFGGLPYCFQFMEPTETRIYPIIKIIAAPGVAIEMENYPRYENRSMGLLIADDPLVQIIRVQDPHLIPPIGMGIHANHILSDEVIGTPFLRTNSKDNSSFSILYSPVRNYFEVKKMPSGIIIVHPKSETYLFVTVPETQANTRFAYAIYPDGIDNEYVRTNQQTVLLLITSEVKVEISYPIRFALSAEEAAKNFEKDIHIEVYKSYDLNEIPCQGEDFFTKISPSWEKVPGIKRNPSLEEELLITGYDIGLSAIPIIGDIIDIGEFFYGIVAGKDKWGRKVSTMDLVLMGIGALIPFVGSGSLKGGKRLHKIFGSETQKAKMIIDELTEAGVSKQDMEIIQTVQNLIIKGEKVPLDLLKKNSDILKKIKGEGISLYKLLNANKSGFTHADLQAAYRNYVNDKITKGELPAEPEKWIKLTRNEKAIFLLKSLLGPDYMKSVKKGGRMISLSAIPKPVNVSDLDIEKYIQLLLKTDTNKLFERLEKIVSKLEATDLPFEVLGDFKRIEKIEDAYFSILKGNIAEVLSLGYQKEVLKNLGKTSKNKSAKLYTGIRMRTIDNSGTLSSEKLFSDNIIGRVTKNGHLEIFTVFEVKSGYASTKKGIPQIFDWVEKNIEEGCQLIIPKGSKIIDSSGGEIILKSDQVFTYFPKDVESKRVFRLTSADRHFVTPKGLSYTGINSSQQIAAEVIPHELNETSELIDFLTAEIFKRIKLNIGE